MDEKGVGEVGCGHVVVFGTVHETLLFIWGHSDVSVFGLGSQGTADPKLDTYGCPEGVRDEVHRGAGEGRRRLCVVHFGDCGFGDCVVRQTVQI